MKTIFVTIGKLLLLTILMQIIWSVGLGIGSQLFPFELSTSGVDAGQLFLRMTVVCLIHTSLLYTLIHFAVWKGWKLASLLALEIFVIQFALSAVEALFFGGYLKMPANLAWSMIFTGIILSLVWSPLAVLISGNWKQIDSSKHLKTATGNMFWMNIALLSVVVYPFLYQLAGYFIAWRVPEVRALYDGLEAQPTFIAQLGSFVFSELHLLQIIRGLVWIAIAIPVMLAMKSSMWMKALMVGLLFALLMNAQHLLPNALMVPEVRLAHFIETASSNFVWGFVIVWLLSKSGFTRSSDIGEEGKLAAA
ncbi:hypothetical protein [Prolixibacter denitrificans]|uniref:Uncharacterized protein n=1 Tax=Prolixibacter denitrificans TaxID=1541063 RepID=A0A2P8C728_9BACT|nr:hypothetical protein [Prolixibacter denitrificans]PSK80756.1 hypothetical protein CLV93_11350 [Prolixibacter denitrificans]GET22445.1 hypothetical protein JCM18694_26910 [Prolixibacter denitrificans]